MTTATTPCVHHYLVATPSGPTVPGVCRRCGATRVYETALGWKRSWPAGGHGFGRKVTA